ncbi:peptidoglycan/LPS O-acetylase OafA/YrhL [Novosphingobium sp. SG707]|nr:peptidoglycan/LPS O-acetylase OafA/YrhL [Novosphingobium sp. SG707]
MMNDAPSPNRHSRGKFDTVQALRFLAAFMVVWVHSTFYTHERLDASTAIFALGANGVRLFFVISGFVMVVSSQRLIGAARRAQVFAMKRILRIVPLYWLVTSVKLVALLAAPAVVLHAKVDWGYVIRSYLFIPAVNVDGEIKPLLGVGWTLNFEMFFYALFALALLIRIRPLLLIAPVLVLLSGLSLLHAPDWPPELLFWSDPIILDFLAGMVLAGWVGQGKALPVPVAALSALAGLGWLFVPWLHPIVPGLVGSLLTTLAAGVVVAGAVALEPVLGPRMPRFALFMGAASYSLYLVHPLVAPASPHVLGRLGIHTPVLAVILSILVAMVAGALCYLLVEMPISRITDGWAKRREFFTLRQIPAEQS